MIMVLWSKLVVGMVVMKFVVIKVGCINGCDYVGVIAVGCSNGCDDDGVIVVM